MTSLSCLIIDELADGICLRAGQIAAAEAELLRWIAEFDRRGGWGGPGMLSCGHWLSWRTGLSLGTAHERVRVAHRLEELPEVAAAFGDGRLSYSKVRAITRVAASDDGVDWVMLGRSSSAAQLEKIVRGVVRARRHAEAAADPEAAAWPLRTTMRYDEHGNFTLTIRGPAQYAPVVRAGLEAKKAALQREREAADTEAKSTEANSTETEGTDARGDAPAVVAAPEQDRLPLDEAPPTATAPVLGPAPTPDDDAVLDEQAPGWPEGTTRRQAREAMDGFGSFVRRLREESGTDVGVTDEAAAGDDEPRVPTAPQPAAGAAAGGAAGGEPGTASVEPEEPAPVTDADALLALAQEAIASEEGSLPEVARRRRRQLTAQIDPLSGWSRLRDGEVLPPTSLSAHLKTLPGRGGVLRLRPLTPADLRRHDLGRTSRQVSANLRELLGTIDGERCRFPGCTRRRKLHGHHVVYWSHGGSTDIDNLVLVCARHHSLIHSQGFRLVLHPDRRLEVSTADGVRVLHHPAQPWGDPAALASGCGQLVSAETLPPDHCDARLDLRYVVSVLLAQAS